MSPTKQATKETKTNTIDITNSVRVSTPIYVGVSQDDAKTIVAKLREQAEDAPTSTDSSIGSVSVETFTTSQKLAEMEQRLRIDLRTLRQLLFNSMRQGVQLDLMLRIQRELGDSMTVISDEAVNKGFADSVTRYHSYL